jgi:N4-gp56 family major capsid protein
MAYVEILTSNDLTVEQWDSQLFSEYLGQLFWMPFMGTSTNAAIQMLENLSKAAGDAINVPLRSQMKGGRVRGNAKGIGNEGRMDFYNFRLTIDNERQLIKFEDVPMSEKRTSFSLLRAGRDGLVEKTKYALEDDITTALIDTAVGRVRGRYLYGAADSNWNATHATALQNIDNTSDQLSTSMIGIAKRKATIPVNATARVRPMKVKGGARYEEWFDLVAHTYAIRDMLRNDAAWRNAQLNLPPNANRDSVLFTGSSFKGAWEGVLLHEWDRIALATSTIQYAHNLLLGAQAGAVAWGQRSKFGEEETDVGHDVTYETHEIRGQKKMVFDRASVSGEDNEDHGLINVFTAAVAD